MGSITGWATEIPHEGWWGWWGRRESLRNELIFEHVGLFWKWFSVQFSSVTQLCLTLCNPMNRSTAGFSVLHNLQEFAQTHVHCVSNAIQSSHPLSSPSPLAFNLSQQDGQLWEDNLSAPCCKAFPPPLLPASTADLPPTLSVSRHPASSVSLRGLHCSRTGHELGMFPYALQR